MKEDKRVFWNGWHAVPMKGTFLFTAMVGFLISAYLVYPRSSDYGITLMLIFILMFIASLVSLSKAPNAKIQ